MKAAEAGRTLTLTLTPTLTLTLTLTRFIHDDAALRCLKEGCIEFTPFAFCSEPLDRTNAISKVLRRVERYVGRGFELRGVPAA